MLTKYFCSRFYNQSRSAFTQSRLGIYEIFSSFSAASENKTEKPLEREKKINKLLYRAKQRGLLEMDLLMGKWAETEVKKMDDSTLSQFENLLDQETPDLYKWVTGQTEPPREIQQNKAFKALCDEVQNKLNENSQPNSRNTSGSQWLRGWLDKGNQ